MTPLSRNARFVVITACTLLLLSFGYRAGFGLFVKPFSEANGWGREVISFALALQNLAWGIVAVFAGGLADKFGNVFVLVAGAILYGLGMWLMSFADTPLALYLSAGILVGAGIAGTSFGIVLPALARAVPEDRRQWVLGVGTAAGSLGQFLIVPLLQGLVSWFDWQTALVILALSTLGLIILALPLGPYSGAVEAAVTNDTESAAAAFKKAFGHQSYVLLTIGFFVCGFHVAFITAHMPAYLSDLGFSAEVGAWSIALIGLCNVFGAYLAGVWSGRVAKRSILVGIYFARAIVISIFLAVDKSLAVILVFSAVMGFLWLATVPPTSGLVAAMFGTRYMAMLYGFVFLSHQLGSFTGVWLGGWLHDQTGSYDAIWWCGAVLGLVAALLHWPIKENQAHLVAAK